MSFIRAYPNKALKLYSKFYGENQLLKLDNNDNPNNNIKIYDSENYII